MDETYVEVAGRWRYVCRAVDQFGQVVDVFVSVDAALAAAIAVLVLQTAGAGTAVMVAGGVVAFLAVWGGLMPLQRHTADPLRRGRPRFPTPPQAP